MIGNFVPDSGYFSIGIIAKLQGCLAFLNSLGQNVFVFNEMLEVDFQPDNIVGNQEIAFGRIIQ